MNCEDAREYWSLYHDSEGDAALHFEIAQHLSRCEACAEWFARRSYLETLVEEKVRTTERTPELWSAVLAGAGVLRPAVSRRWLIFASLACAAMLLIATTWWSLPDSTVGGASLSALSAGWHDRLADGRESVPFESDSDLAVEDYLKQHVSFPVRCPPRKDAGFAVRGAGSGTLAGQPAAWLVGNVDDAAVSIFILSRDSLHAFPHQEAALRQEQVHRCREGRYEMALSVIDENIVLVIGQTTPKRLLNVLKAYGTYPHHGPA